MDARVVAERRERDDLDVVVARPQLAGRLDAVDGRHLQIHQNDLGSSPLRVEPRELGDGFPPVAGLADDLQIAFAVEEAPQPPADDDVVVDDQDPDRAVPLRRHPARAAGSRPTRRRSPSVACVRRS